MSLLTLSFIGLCETYRVFVVREPSAENMIDCSSYQNLQLLSE